jgi:hypothetical protein
MPCRISGSSRTLTVDNLFYAARLQNLHSRGRKPAHGVHPACPSYKAPQRYRSPASGSMPEHPSVNTPSIKVGKRATTVTFKTRRALVVKGRDGAARRSPLHAYDVPLRAHWRSVDQQLHAAAHQGRRTPRRPRTLRTRTSHARNPADQKPCSTTSVPSDSKCAGAPWITHRRASRPSAPDTRAC